MYLLSTQGFLSDNLVKAVCWVLVHSLWQGLLLAGISGAIILFTKRRSAALRYTLLTSALLIFVLGVAFNLYLQLNNSFTQTTLLIQQEAATETSAAIESANAAPVIAHISFMDDIAGFFNRYAAAIVFVWFMVIGVKMAQMMAGLYSIQQIKKRKLSTVGSYWSLRVQQLSNQMGITNPVQFLQSGIVKVPMVIGYFKPVILFPIGALASLSPADVEAILLHELAHIRRRDYLVNMLQHVVEILFFFNPAVLWVSAVIKTERENCCDDIALAYTRNRHGYINALVSFQEFDQAQPAYATALTGKKDHLFQRVKRIVTNNNKSLNNMEKIFLIICFLFTGTLTLVFAQKKTPTEDPRKIQTEKTVKKTTILEKQEPLAATEKTRVLQQLTAEEIAKEMDIRTRQHQQKLQDSVQAALDKSVALNLKSIAEKDKTILIAEKKELEKQRQIMEADRKRADAEIKKANEKKSTSKSTTSVKVERVEDTDKYRTITGLSYSTNVNTNVSTNINNRINTNVNVKDIDVNDLTNKIIADLKTKGIITTSDNLSYQLSNDQLIVNNVVQPAAVHAVLKANYIKSENWKLMYNWKMKTN